MLHQVQDQSLRPLTTAHLAQTMSLLCLSNLELRDRIQTELSSNPALELVEERLCPTCHRPLTNGRPCPACAQQPEAGDAVVFLSPRTAVGSSAPSLDEAPLDSEPAAPLDLPTHVLEQLAGQLTADERPLAAYILASLDDDGFLRDHPANIALATRSTLAQVHKLLELISRADPPGLATAGPREALLAQLELSPLGDPRVALAKRMLQETFSELGRREYTRIAERLVVGTRQVREAANFIRTALNPYPARAFWGSGRQPQAPDPNVYHSPDISVSHSPSNDGQTLMVEIFSPVSGWLRVNPLFRQALPEATPDKADQWAQQLDRAALFVKCLQQRGNTMRRLMEILVSGQKEFILNGDRYLRPLTRASVAIEVGVHESTISRAVAHKSIGLPDGRIIPLARFFDRSLSVRDRIKEIVEAEDRPLTDDEIVAILAEDGVLVARRTVAKYRAMEGILPARLRHRKRERPSTRH
jgi:RNA polymerase sigma-54 factor